MSLTAYERETVIRLGDDTDQASVWTCQSKIARRLQKRGVKPSEVRKQAGREIAWRFIIPAKWVKLSPPRKVLISEEERALRAQRMAKLGSVTRGPRANPAKPIVTT